MSTLWLLGLYLQHQLASSQRMIDSGSFLEGQADNRGVKYVGC